MSITTPTVVPAPEIPAQPSTAGSPPVDNLPPAPAPAKTIPADWRDRLTDTDYPTLVAVLREHHARRRPLHSDALSILVRLTEGTTR